MLASSSLVQALSYPWIANICELSVQPPMPFALTDCIAHASCNISNAMLQRSCCISILQQVQHQRLLHICFETVCPQVVNASKRFDSTSARQDTPTRFPSTGWQPYEFICQLQDTLLDWHFLRTWSPEQHHLYPAQFRSVTQALLLGASQYAAQPQIGAEQHPLHSSCAVTSM